MDKCIFVVHLFYTHVCTWFDNFDAMHGFAFAHTCDMCVPFKLWVICAVPIYIFVLKNA